MSEHYHAIVWIDHQQARLFHFDAEAADREVIRSHSPERHIHHKANSIGSGHAAQDRHFLHEVALALHDAGAVVITGPGNAKQELIKYIEHHDPQLLPRVRGVETLDHPTDGALVAYARHYFRSSDRMRSQRE